MRYSVSDTRDFLRVMDNPHRFWKVYGVRLEDGGYLTSPWRQQVVPIGDGLVISDRRVREPGRDALDQGDSQIGGGIHAFLRLRDTQHLARYFREPMVVIPVWATPGDLVAVGREPGGCKAAVLMKVRVWRQEIERAIRRQYPDIAERLGLNRKEVENAQSI